MASITTEELRTNASACKRTLASLREGGTAQPNLRAETLYGSPMILLGYCNRGKLCTKAVFSFVNRHCTGSTPYSRLGKKQHCDG